MKPNKTSRRAFGIKNPQEALGYRRSLEPKDVLDKTESDPIDSNKTDESSFEEPKGNNNESNTITRKSTWLKIKDAINNHWTVAIVGGLIVLAIGGCVTLISRWNRELGVHNEKIIILEKKTDDLNKGMEDMKSSYTKLNLDYSIFKEGTGKDLENLKSKE